MEEKQENYEEAGLDTAYSLQNAGGLVLVCTKGAIPRLGGGEPASAGSSASEYDLAPVAWCCPLDYAPVSKMIVVCDTSHKTYADILASGFFALALPTFRQKKLVEDSGSVSGRDVDKYSRFAIDAFKGRKVDVLIPSGVAGWLECKLERVDVLGSSGVVYGEVVGAWARPGAWKERLHFVSGDVYFAPGPALG